MSESIREVRSDEVEILQDIAKRTFYHTFKSSYDDRDFNKFLKRRITLINYLVNFKRKIHFTIFLKMNKSSRIFKIKY